MTVYYTAGIKHNVETVRGFGNFVLRSLERFIHNDWGNICEEDVTLNDKNPEFAMGTYECNENRVWVIRNLQTITLLLPEEY